MQINNINTKINFCKRLEAKASVIKNGKPFPCDIYSLNYKEDKLYFDLLSNNSKWDMGYFPEVASIDFTSPYSPYTFYAIENQEEGCLGYAEILKKSPDDTGEEEKIEISILETCPDYSKNNGFRKAKYIGETLLSFIVEKAKKENINKICVPSYRDSAYSFYTNNCYFEDLAFSKDRLVLTKDKYDWVLERNKEHTGHHIQFEV